MNVEYYAYAVVGGGTAGCIVVADFPRMQAQGADVHTCRLLQKRVQPQPGLPST